MTSIPPSLRQCSPRRRRRCVTSQAASARAMRGGICGEFDARRRRSRRAWPPAGRSRRRSRARAAARAGLKPADEVDRAGELAPQHRLGAEHSRHSRRRGRRRNNRGVVARRVEIAGLGPAQAALRAPQDVAAVLVIEKLLRVAVPHAGQASIRSFPPASEPACLPRTFVRTETDAGVGVSPLAGCEVSLRFMSWSNYESAAKVR